jgi:hypothetical protein
MSHQQNNADSPRIWASICLCLIIVIVLLGKQLVVSKQQAARQQSEQKLQQAADHINNYLDKYTTLAKTVTHEPSVVQWFKKHNQRGADLSKDAGYLMVNKHFHNISDNDPNIYSAFFGTEQTAEYFREDEITGAKVNYYTTKRPWYMAAKKNEQIYFREPIMDHTTAMISSAVQHKVYGEDRTFLGISGIDLSLQPIVEYLDKIDGTAILISGEGNLIYGAKKLGLENKVKLSESATQLNPYFTKPVFSKLGATLKTGDSGFDTLNFSHQSGQSSYHLLYQQVGYGMTTQPWTLAILFKQ